MGALTVHDRRAVEPRQVLSLKDDAFDSFLKRVQDLIKADAIVMFAIDAATSAASIVGSVGQVDSLAVRNLSSLENDQPFRLSGLVRSVGVSGAEISRIPADAKHGDVLSISVSMTEASVLIVAVRAVISEPFTVNDERAARRMSDWIADYVRLWWRQHRERDRGDSLQAALDLVGNAVFVTDGRGQLINTNSAARQLLDAGNGLRQFGNMLTAVSLEDAARLHTSIAHVASMRERDATLLQAPVLSIRRERLRPLSVAVMRGRPGRGLMIGDDELVVIQAVDPQGDIEQLVPPACTVYGLTAAETRLASLLVSGVSLADAATRMKIRAPTASTYLKQIFAKTGTNRQASLVLLLLTTIVRTAPNVTLTALH